VLGADALSPWRHTIAIAPLTNADVTAGREGFISASEEWAATMAAGHLAAREDKVKEVVVKSIREKESRHQQAAARAATRAAAAEPSPSCALQEGT